MNLISDLGHCVNYATEPDFLSLDFGVKEFGEGQTDERIIKYRKYIYETGAVKSGKGAAISIKVVKKEQKKKYKLTRADRFMYRSRYFTDSGIIGSKAFVTRNFIRFKDFLEIKKDRNPSKIKGMKGVYSLKRLTGK